MENCSDIVKRTIRQSRWLLLTLAILMLMHAKTGLAQDNTDSDNEALKVSDYKNLPVLVLDMAANSADVTTDAVRNRVELRMRAAGIKPTTEEGNSFLYVFVRVDGDVYYIDVGFYRHASWELPDGKKAENYLETWNSGNALGMHGKSATTVLDSLDKLVDKFLNVYLKANV